MEISPAGGNGGYKLTLDGNTVTSAPYVFNDLAVGIHPFTIVDGINGLCQSSGSVEIVNRPDPLSGSTSVSQPSCQGYSDGSITVTGIDGDGPYTFAIDLGSGLNFSSPSTSTTFTNLQGNRSYDIYIRDSNYDAADPDLSLCQVVLSVNLPDAPP